MCSAYVGVLEDQMEEFKVGDVVILKSGGPLLTVVETGLEQNSVRVHYFSGDELKDAYLFAESLKKYS